MYSQTVLVIALAVAGAAVADNYRPTVLWHGMGDTCCNPLSLGRIKHVIEQELKGIYVHSIQLGNNFFEDELEGFFGNVNHQVDAVCAKLKNDTRLKDGFNAVGFSQGGQFLRAYVERCNDPPVHNLVTLGGQHMGVADFPHCTATNTTICELVARVLSAGAYAPGVRDFQVQAQYFRSPYEMKQYLEHNIFLADINNELSTKNETYKKNLMSLANFVMVQFTEDTMVVPRASEIFGAFKEGAESTIVPMRQQPIYMEDWIGLQQLDKTNRIKELYWKGDHLQFSTEQFKTDVIIPYLNNTV